MGTAIESETSGSLIGRATADAEIESVPTESALKEEEEEEVVVVVVVVVEEEVE